MFSYMSLDQHRLILKSFFDSQFGCCPLIWMNHSRELNNKIDRIHEKGCRIVHRNKKSTVDELLDKFYKNSYQKSPSTGHRYV